MPKDRRSSSLDHRYRLSPYSWSNTVRRKPRSLAIPVGNEKEWEEARCPICMEHPHNAVLLLCSSFEKGCRPYMCDTSSRHSNCLDQFRKSSVNKGADAKLVCPLCRGRINKCIKNKPARLFMDSKTRRCSMDTCNYTGNYLQLRKHAKCTHPHVRPTDVDPERELEWRNLEEYMQLQDLFSMLFDFHEIDDEDIEEELTDGQDMNGEDIDPGLELRCRNLAEDIQLDDQMMISMQFDFHEIDDENIEEELTDGQDMDGENVDPGLELEWRNLAEGIQPDDQMISMQFDFHEIDDEDIEEELTDGQDMDGEDVDPGLELERRNLAEGIQLVDQIVSMLFDYYEFEEIWELLNGDSDLSSPNMNNIH